MAEFVRLTTTIDGEPTEVWVNPDVVTHFHHYIDEGTIIFFAASSADGQKWVVVSEEPQAVAMSIAAQALSTG